MTKYHSTGIHVYDSSNVICRVEKSSVSFGFPFYIQDLIFSLKSNAAISESILGAPSGASMAEILYHTKKGKLHGVF